MVHVDLPPIPPAGVPTCRSLDESESSPLDAYSSYLPSMCRVYVWCASHPTLQNISVATTETYLMEISLDTSRMPYLSLPRSHPSYHGGAYWDHCHSIAFSPVFDFDYSFLRASHPGRTSGLRSCRSLLPCLAATSLAYSRFRSDGLKAAFGAPLELHSRLAYREDRKTKTSAACFLVDNCD